MRESCEKANRNWQLCAQTYLCESHPKGERHHLVCTSWNHRFYGSFFRVFGVFRGLTALSRLNQCIDNAVGGVSVPEGRATGKGCGLKRERRCAPLRLQGYRLQRA